MSARRAVVGPTRRAVVILCMARAAAAYSPMRARPFISQPAAMAQSRADAAFEAAVQHCSAAMQTQMLSQEVPGLLRTCFAEDHQAHLERVVAINSPAKLVQNVTCMRPAEGVDGSWCFDEALFGLSLREGRACVGGACCDACSRVCWPDLATPEEMHAFRTLANQVMAPVEEHPQCVMPNSPSDPHECSSLPPRPLRAAAHSPALRVRSPSSQPQHVPRSVQRCR